MTKTKKTTPTDYSKSQKESAIIKALEWVYKKSLNPQVKGIESAYELANRFNNTEKSLDNNINDLIVSQNIKSASSGFVLGLGGFITMPATLPADITSTLFIQIRMVLAIAIMSGFDKEDERVKLLVYSCLADTVEEEVIHEIKSQLVSNVAQTGITTAIKNISVTHATKLAIKNAQAAASVKIASHVGAKGGSHLSKVIPFLGGIVGGTINSWSTNKIGNRAKTTFIS